MLGLIDRPVVIRTLKRASPWHLYEGVVFEVLATTVELQTSPVTLETIPLAEIVEVTLDARAARDQVLEAPPAHPDYARAKRRLFQAEQALLFGGPVATIASDAALFLRRVRRDFVGHEKTARMLERAHFLATGGCDWDPWGPVEDHNYRAAKAAAAALKEALEKKRPESEVALHVIAIARSAGRALANHPGSSDLLTWFNGAERVRARLSETLREELGLTKPFVPGRE
jgi:hypothetical protein